MTMSSLDCHAQPPPRERLPQWAIDAAKRAGIRWYIDRDLASIQRDIYTLSFLIGRPNIDIDALPEPKEKNLIAREQEILRRRREELRKHAREAAQYAKALLPSLQSSAFWQALRLARSGASAAAIEAETRHLASLYDVPIEAIADAATQGARAGWEEWKKTRKRA